ncbi:hypothetical protein ACI2KR_08770 [Pseudomonas luteola]
MKALPFTEATLVTYVNKVLEELRVTHRMTSLEDKSNSDALYLTNGKASIRATVSDFGMGDIGLANLTISVGEHHKTFVGPALSARILPTREDFVAFQAQKSGPASAQVLLDKIDSLSTLKMGNDVRVLRDGKDYSFSEYVTMRPRKGQEYSDLSLAN